MKKRLFQAAAILSLFNFSASILQAQCPTGLMTDLIEHSEQIFIDGYASSAALTDLNDIKGRYQAALIHSSRPRFSWIVGSNRPHTKQTAYHILVATSPDKLKPGAADIWDSKKTESRHSTSITMDGKELSPSTIYYWKVKTWDNHGYESPWSAAKSFMTAGKTDGTASHYPLQFTDERPINTYNPTSHIRCFDFGRDAIGQLRLTVMSEHTDTIIVRLGEVRSANGRVEQTPGGSRRYAEYKLALMPGLHTYDLKLKPDARNSDPATAARNRLYPIFLPDYAGVVFPFRYVEAEGSPQTVNTIEPNRRMLHYSFNDAAAHFNSSDTVLNKIWELCRYSMKATSFCGIYVDGDRERIAYEADAIINQLSHYCVDREFSMARRTIEHLIFHPTWPTEWCLQTLILAWNDYMYSGDKRLLERYYSDLKAKTLLALRESNGLISTKTGKNTPELCKTIHYDGNALKDIVDWPQSGHIGNEKEYGGEADGVKMDTFNATVNAFHYQAVKLLGQIAQVIGKDSDAHHYADEAGYIRKQFNRLFFDKKNGRYRDGLSTDHSALHSNMFPLAFGMVDPRNMKTVTDYIKSRRMACSVYGAQFLLDGLYEAGEADYAYSLLASTAQRSWYNMLRAGSTITMEAWDNIYKPNQDWNHAWGAAPGNLISRGLMGITPLKPGFERIRVKPQPGKVKQASLLLPTVRGNILTEFKHSPEGDMILTIDIPANCTAEVWFPCKNRQVLVDGTKAKGKKENGWFIMDVGSGKHIVR